MSEFRGEGSSVYRLHVTDFFFFTFLRPECELNEGVKVDGGGMQVITDTVIVRGEVT